MSQQLPLLDLPELPGPPPAPPLPETFPFHRRGARAGVGQLRVVTDTCGVCGGTFHASQLGRRPHRCPDCARRRAPAPRSQP